MEETEKIRGEGLTMLLRQLQKDRTILHVHLQGTDYERLTLILQVKERPAGSFFQIDEPDGFREAIAAAEGWRLRFEFKGEGEVAFRFQTREGEIRGRELWVRFPYMMERLQRRQHFRMNPPLGTRITGTYEEQPLAFHVLNVSQSGALVSQDSHVPGNTAPKDRETLIDLMLTFPEDTPEQRIRIKKATVVAAEKDSIIGQQRYRLHFSDFDKDERVRFLKMIYMIQREFLRKR